MNLLLFLCIVLLIGSADVWLTSSSLHFGDQEDMTLISRFETDIRTQVTWFKQDLSGNVTLVKLFSQQAYPNHDRYFVSVDGSNIMLTVTQITAEDSGRYFAVRLNGLNFEAGTIQDIAVTVGTGARVSLRDGVKAAMCVCRRESTGTMIQSGIQILTTKKVTGSCDILLYVVLLTCLLLLLAGAAAAVRATRSGCVTAYRLSRRS
ncbi:uncharacterized protein LOC124482850 isoform X3 [Hypomesus transpacificus]|uniref:uncharacterized protein LOC124482850 isoform X3 n=1 Tax=Hypomesus transpacificus TaxID=137520 RepID=UPI001F07AB3B|nr:uncharacterized protein LOC124482850 isoform X3 [Hypomesus transpacificus]